MDSPLRWPLADRPSVPADPEAGTAAAAAAAAPAGATVAGVGAVPAEPASPAASFLAGPLPVLFAAKSERETPPDAESEGDLDCALAELCSCTGVGGCAGAEAARYCGVLVLTDSCFLPPAAPAPASRPPLGASDPSEAVLDFFLGDLLMMPFSEAAVDEDDDGVPASGSVASGWEASGLRRLSAMVVCAAAECRRQRVPARTLGVRGSPHRGRSRVYPRVH